MLCGSRTDLTEVDAVGFSDSLYIPWASFQLILLFVCTIYLYSK